MFVARLQSRRPISPSKMQALLTKALEDFDVEVLEVRPADADDAATNDRGLRPRRNI